MLACLLLQRRILKNLQMLVNIRLAEAFNSIELKLPDQIKKQEPFICTYLEDQLNKLKKKDCPNVMAASKPFPLHITHLEEWRAAYDRQPEQGSSSQPIQTPQPPTPSQPEIPTVEAAEDVASAGMISGMMGWLNGSRK